MESAHKFDGTVLCMITDIIYMYYIQARTNLYKPGNKLLNAEISIKKCKKFSTVLIIIKLTKNPVPLRFPVNGNFVVISLCFAILKNVVHSLEPGEMPSNLASHQAPNYVQHSSIFAKYFKMLHCGCGYFFNLLKTITVNLK